MKVTSLICIGSLVLLLMALGGDGRADNDANQTSKSGSVTKLRDQTSTERKFPIAVPPASEVLSRIRGQKRPRPPVQEKKEELSPQVRLLRQVMGQGARAPVAPNVNQRGMSFAPQWPVGLRQLPVNGPRLPVARRPSVYRPRSYTSGGSRLEWGINLKTHRFQPYYRLNRFGNTTLGLSLRGKRTLGQYYRIGHGFR